MVKNKLVAWISGFSLILLLLAFSMVSACSSTSSPSSAPVPKAVPSTPVTSAPASAPVSTVVPKTAAVAPSSVVASSELPKPAEPAKTFVLKFASQVQPMSSVGRVNKQWADMVKQQSGGRLEIQLYLSETLAKATEIYKAVQTGVVDMAYTTVGQDPGLTPLGTVTRLPFIGIPSQAAAMSIQWDLFNKFPELQNEWKGMKVVGFASLPGDQLQLVKKEAHVPADIRGMKIIARGEWPDVMQNMGVAPVSLNVGDWYGALDKGLAEGQIINFAAANAFKILEILKYHVLFGDGGCSTTMQIYIVNNDSWNKLPSDLQKVLADSFKWQCDEMVKTDMSEQSGIINDLKAAKHTFVNLKPEEISLWMDAARPRHQSWVKENTDRGLPGQAVYDETLRLIKQYSK
jgi:TRAP-type transport system periplasmic protein